MNILSTLQKDTVDGSLHHLGNITLLFKKLLFKNILKKKNSIMYEEMPHFILFKKS